MPEQWLALLTVGLVAGVAVSGAAFAYQGQYPVNLFSLLGVLVGFGAGFMLAVALLEMLPGALRAEPAKNGQPMTYVFDPTNPVPSSGGATLGPRAGMQPQDLSARPDVLSFVTAL